ncbi:MAG: hypothetical protein AABW56_03980 [Nanoarchaeota archaeon]|mgnify:CR=1 FL=1
MSKDEEVEDIYSEDYSEKLEEDDSIDEAEEAFMQGYNEEKFITECVKYGKILGNMFIEEKSGKKTYRFCSQNCANEFLSQS